MVSGEKADRNARVGIDDDHLLALIVRENSNPVILMDLYGRLLYANVAAARMHDSTPEQMRGMSIERVVELQNSSHVLRQLRDNQSVQLESDVLRSDGSRRPAWISIFPLHDESPDPPSAAGALFYDLSTQRQAMAQTQQQLMELQLLNKVSLAVNSSLDVEQILSILLEETRETLGAEACSVALLDEEHNDLFFLMAEGIGSGRVRGTRMPADMGVIGWVVRNGQPLIVPEVSEDNRFFTGIDNLTGARTRSLMCTPLEAHGKVIGAIEAMNKRGGDFDSEDLRMFKLIAASAATAIANALLYSEQEAAARRLTEKNRELIEGRNQEIRRERIEALGQVGVTIQHEINNPLTGILSLSEWLLRREDLPQDLSGDLGTIREQALRIKYVVRRLSELQDDRTVNFLGDRKMIDLGLG